MSITLYGIPNCDTVRKARKWLEGRNIAYTFHDFRTDGLEQERLGEWVGKVGWQLLLNKASTTFRALSDSDKQDMNEEKAKTLLLAHPTMIKRPVLERGGEVLVGFKPDIYEAQVKV